MIKISNYILYFSPQNFSSIRRSFVFSISTFLFLFLILFLSLNIAFGETVNEKLKREISSIKLPKNWKLEIENQKGLPFQWEKTTDSGHLIIVKFYLQVSKEEEKKYLKEKPYSSLYKGQDKYEIKIPQVKRLIYIFEDNQKNGIGYNYPAMERKHPDLLVGVGSVETTLFIFKSILDEDEDEDKMELKEQNEILKEFEEKINFKNISDIKNKSTDFYFITDSLPPSLGKSVDEIKKIHKAIKQKWIIYHSPIENIKGHFFQFIFPNQN